MTRKKKRGGEGTREPIAPTLARGPGLIAARCFLRAPSAPWVSYGRGSASPGAPASYFLPHPPLPPRIAAPAFLSEPVVNTAKSGGNLSMSGPGKPRSGRSTVQRTASFLSLSLSDVPEASLVAALAGVPFSSTGRGSSVCGWLAAPRPRSGRCIYVRGVIV